MKRIGSAPSMPKGMASPSSLSYEYVHQMMDIEGASGSDGEEYTNGPSPHLLPANSSSFFLSSSSVARNHPPSPRGLSARRRSRVCPTFRAAQTWLPSTHRKRAVVLRSFLAASLLVLFVLLIIYWPYLDMYWLRPQWRRVEAGWRSLRGDHEHLARENTMAARTEFYKRQLLRLPRACEALSFGHHHKVQSPAHLLCGSELLWENG